MIERSMGKVTYKGTHMVSYQVYQPFVPVVHLTIFVNFEPMHNSNPYNSPFWEKTNGGRIKTKMTKIMATEVALLSHALRLDQKQRSILVT